MSRRIREENDFMIRTSKPARGILSMRSALGTALALGIAAGAVTISAPAMAAKQQEGPKITLSKTFQPLAVALNNAINQAKTRADVVAAKANAANARAALQQARGTARTQASANYNAALAALGTTLAAEKTQLDTTFAGIAGPGDRFMFGQLAIGLGTLAEDPAIQRRGINAMIESGQASPADLPRLNFFAGQLAFEAKEYPAARTALQAAITGGYHENDVEVLLAESYMSDNQIPQGLVLLQQAIDQRNATPNKAPASWYRRGLGAAYNAKLLDQAVNFSMGLVKAYPTTESWAGAITVVREVGKFPAQETLDLMRLMDRTKSYAEDRDYVDYIEAADARRFPGEVLRIIGEGVAAGKLRTNDVFVTDARTIANARVAEDRASLPGVERDARAANATAVTVMAAADVFLSYGDNAKAESLYTIALGKPGVDAPRVLTRVGIAQVDQGKYADAQATFARVEGSRKSIAQLWAIYAAQKAAPPPAAAPAAN
jgi:hypothetical protein